MLGRWQNARLLINPMIQFLRPISPLAWIPLAMLWFGIGDKPAVFLIFLSSFFPIVVSTTATVSAINPIYFQVGANFNFTRWEMITRVIVPAMIPGTITALRISVTIAWLVVVAAEMIAVQSGLGYLILDSRNALANGLRHGRHDCHRTYRAPAGLLHAAAGPDRIGRLA